MSYLAKVAALEASIEASIFRAACGLPPREELASPAAFRAALAVAVATREGVCSDRQVAERYITVLLA